MVRKNSKQKIINYEQSIRKSNELSMAKMNRGLSLNQMQLFAYAIYCAQQNGVTEFHKADFEKQFGVSQYKTEDAKKDSRRIMNLQVSLEDKKADVFEYWNVFVSMRYEKGLFRFMWSEPMIPHVLELKERFYVTTDLTIASKFRSGFSWTLYEYLKAHYGYWYKTIPKAGLMELFNVHTVKSYANNSGVFKQKVLDMAIKEVNEHTELSVDYREVKKGRSIAYFRLEWSHGTNTPAATRKQLDELQGIIRAISEDADRYINVDRKEDRINAMRLIKEVEGMSAVADGSVGVTNEKVSSLIQKAVFNMNTLNKQLGKVREGDVKKVDFYNWLDDRE